VQSFPFLVNYQLFLHKHMHTDIHHLELRLEDPQ